MLCLLRHVSVALCKRSITFLANSWPFSDVLESPTISLVASYKPIYPKEIVAYPPSNNGRIGAPLGRRAMAPYCQ